MVRDIHDVDLQQIRQFRHILGPVPQTFNNPNPVLLADGLQQVGALLG
jgi:hypothetical protein